MPDLDEKVLPVVWSLARRALEDGPASSLSVLAERLTPDGLIRRTAESASGSRHVGPSLRALVQTGVLVEDPDESVHLSDSFTDEAAFRSAVATALLSIPNGDDPWEVREGSTRLEHHLEVAVAWTQLLGMSSEVQNWATASELLDQQFSVDRQLLRDTAPFNTLERLTAWLGVTCRIGTRLVPDPTPLIRANLRALVPEPSCSAEELLERSAALFPWMPHGELGRAVSMRMESVPDESAAEGRFPEGLSLALVRLHHEDVIELDSGDDPKSRILLSFNSTSERGLARVRHK